MDGKRELLRHAVATVAYRATRAVSDVPAEFAGFEGAGGRKPVEILAHMGDLFDWALRTAQGNPEWQKSTPLPWPEEKRRFFKALDAFDAFLNSEAPIHGEIDRLMQGPVADALTHIGQLAMLRRMAGSRTRRENFYVAPIVTGRVGAEQAEPESN